MLHMGSALYGHVEAIAAVGADARVWPRPVFRRLGTNCLNHHRNGVVQSLQSFFLGWRVGIGKFASAVSYVAGVHDLRADVVVQVAGQVQDQVTETVAVGKGVGPELLFGERSDKFAHTREFREVASG